MSTNPLWPAPGPPESCDGCAWRYLGGRGRPVWRCRRHRDARVDGGWPACPAFTPSLDCGTCGACCREAYHRVEVGPRDPFLKKQPGLCVSEDGRQVLPRPDGRCVALRGAPGAWSCAVYADRPRTCQDFEVGGGNCLEARRRVGLCR